MPDRHTRAAKSPGKSAVSEANPSIGSDPRPGPSPDVGRVPVLLPLPLSGAYDYLVPADLPLRPGDVVRVPLGRREVVGVVWDRPAGATPEALSASRLKNVLRRYDVPPFPSVQRLFLDWVASYILAPAGAVLRMALSVPAALDPPRSIAAYRLCAEALAQGLGLTPISRGVSATDRATRDALRGGLPGRCPQRPSLRDRCAIWRVRANLAH